MKHVLISNNILIKIEFFERLDEKKFIEKRTFFKDYKTFRPTEFVSTEEIAEESTSILCFILKYKETCPDNVAYILLSGSPCSKRNKAIEFRT